MTHWVGRLAPSTTNPDHPPARARPSGSQNAAAVQPCAYVRGKARSSTCSLEKSKSTLSKITLGELGRYIPSNRQLFRRTLCCCRAALPSSQSSTGYVLMIGFSAKAQPGAAESSGRREIGDAEQRCSHPLLLKQDPTDSRRRPEKVGGVHPVGLAVCLAGAEGECGDLLPSFDSSASLGDRGGSA